MNLNSKEIFLLLIGILFGLFVGILIGKFIKYKILKQERLASIKKSKSVILGEIYEKILPFLPNFPYKPRDMTFVGKAVDYVVFDGLSEGNLEKIVFLEVKSGKSKLNQNEKMIRDIIGKGKVEYKEYKV